MLLEDQRKPHNLRIALTLASVAAAFFVGIVLKFIYFPNP